MTILYVAPVIIDPDNPDGVAKKVLQQDVVLSEISECAIYSYGSSGCTVQKIKCGKIICCRNVSKINRRRVLYSTAYRYCVQNGVNVVYLRYGFCDGQFINFLKKLKKRNVIVILEIATFPYSLSFVGCKGVIERTFDNHYSKQLVGLVDRVVTYTGDRSIYGIECISIHNGILPESLKPICSIANVKDEIHMIAVSTMTERHGYDRVIEGLRLYYESFKDGDIKVIIDLVGDGPEREKYQVLVSEYGLEESVIFHGYLNGGFLESLYSKASVALDCFGCFRQGIHSASTLKTREYLLKGLPIVSACKIGCLDDDYPYVYYFGENEEPVNIGEILQFLSSIHKDSKGMDIVKIIRQYSESKCSLGVTMKPVISFIEGNIHRLKY